MRQENYPVIRPMNPPEFLARKFKDVPALARAALAPLGIVPPKASEETILKTLPTIKDAYAATNSQLLAAVAGAFEGMSAPAKADAEKAFLAQAKRLMTWESIDDVKAAIKPYFVRLIHELPRTLDQLETSGGGRDLLDPFIVAFDQLLLSKGSLEALLWNLLAHKCLMKLEDLIGHLHQEVLGRARGLTPVAEPKGDPGEGGRINKEVWHAEKNPYPGADARLKHEEFYQVKNKTGSAKGSDGEKLGRQFRVLQQKYPESKRYYVSMIGRTLAGHRSMGAFLRTDPDAEVLVGLAAFQQLGGHRDTAEIVLDLYIEEFRTVCDELHFDFATIAARMAAEWRAKHGEGDPAHRLLRDTISPRDPNDQSSRTYDRHRRSTE